MTGDEYLILAENISYEGFMNRIHSSRDKLDNISLGLVTMGYAWEKLDINIDNLVMDAGEYDA